VDRDIAAQWTGTLSAPETSAVLFDLGNTLAAYYRRDEFRPILERAIFGAVEELRSRRIETVPYDAALQKALQENREAGDFRVTPIAERFERILGLSLSDDPELTDTLCRCFLAPIFAVGRVYDDSLPVLDALRSAGLRRRSYRTLRGGAPRVIGVRSWAAWALSRQSMVSSSVVTWAGGSPRGRYLHTLQRGSDSAQTSVLSLGMIRLGTLGAALQLE
jgi:hypothetical protein